MEERHIELERHIACSTALQMKQLGSVDLPMTPGGIGAGTFLEIRGRKLYRAHCRRKITTRSMKTGYQPSTEAVTQQA